MGFFAAAGESMAVSSGLVEFWHAAVRSRMDPARAYASDLRNVNKGHLPEMWSLDGRRHSTRGRIEDDIGVPVGGAIIQRYRWVYIGKVPKWG